MKLSDYEVRFYINHFIQNSERNNLLRHVLSYNHRDCRLCGKRISNFASMRLYYYATPVEVANAYRAIGDYIFTHLCYPCFEAYRVIPVYSIQQELEWIFRKNLINDVE